MDKCCTIYPKLMLKTSQLWNVDAMASGANFPTPSWAWYWHWEWYKNTKHIFQRPCMLNKNLKFMLKACKLWMPKTIILFSNNLMSKSWPWGWYQCNYVFSVGFYVEHNTQNSYLKASKLGMLGSQDSIFQHPFEPESGPERDFIKY